VDPHSTYQATIFNGFTNILIDFISSWLFPFIGHMGIATSDGVIRDFAGSYFVSVSWPASNYKL
jgi:hypothetical protein